MSTTNVEPLAALYRKDKTAWFEATAAMIRDRDLDALDLDNLAEYLNHMGISHRSEVKSRLVVLLVHLLKWEYQPEKRTRSWLSTLATQQLELTDWADRGVLRAYAEAILDKTHAAAVKKVAIETGLPRSTFPVRCPYTVEQLLSMDLPEGEIA